MARPTIQIIDTPAARIVRFDIPGGVTSPEEFASAVADLPSLAGDLPVLVNGRGPVWGYGMLLHVAHPTPAVATYDPRLGYVVVATHDPRWVVGSVISDPEKPAE